MLYLTSALRHIARQRHVTLLLSKLTGHLPGNGTLAGGFILRQCRQRAGTRLIRLKFPLLAGNARNVLPVRCGLALLCGVVFQTETDTLSDTLYVSLADHLNFALKRYSENLEIQNPLEWEVRHLYRKEYLVGRQALALIASRTGQLLPDAEACSITLHIVNASMNVPDGQIMEMTRLIFQIQNIVKYWFAISIDEQSLNYQRFVTHLKFFAQRVMAGEILNNDDAELFAKMPKRYEKTLECVQAISEFVAKNYNHAMSSSEKLYLTVHIGNVLSRQ